MFEEYQANRDIPHVLLNFRKLLRSQLTRYTGGCPDTVTGEATAAERGVSPAKERRPSGE
jgi:hypothetical protein